MASSSDTHSLQSNEFDGLNPLNVESQDWSNITRPNNTGSGSSVVMPEMQQGLDLDPLQDLTLGDWTARVDQSIGGDSTSASNIGGNGSEVDALLGESGGMLTGSPLGSLGDGLLGDAVGAASPSGGGKQIIFVDSSVADDDELLAGLTFQAEIIRLDGSRDGVTQISEALALRQGISSVHIITHGSEGSLQLGNAVLDSETLAAYQSALQGWADSLTGEADILIYGCDVAGNAGGKAFVDQMSQWTGADVAASDDLTGNVMLGGDWLLEYQTGAIESATVSSRTYQSVLASVSLVDGKLRVEDNRAEANQLKFSVENDQFIIEETGVTENSTSTGGFGGSNSLQATGNDITQISSTKVSVALSNITSGIIVDAGAHSDTLTFSSITGFSSAVDITIEAGIGYDTIIFDSVLNTQGGSLTVEGGIGRDFVQFKNGALLTTQGGDLTVRSERLLAETNTVISTRHLSDEDITSSNFSSASSTGDSGNILFKGQEISLGIENGGSATQLLAGVETDSSYSGGDIKITVSETETFATVFDGLEVSRAKIGIENATVTGKDITLTANADYVDSFDDFSVSSPGSVSGRDILGFMDNFSLLGGAAVSTAKAKVNLAAGTNITAHNFSASATATTSAVMNVFSKFVVGAAYGRSDSTAVVSIGGKVTTTGDVSISTATDNTVDVQVKNLTPFDGLAQKSEFLNASSAVAVSELISQSTAEVKNTATITAGGFVNVKATTTDRNHTTAKSGTKSDGTAALSAAVSFENGITQALLDGTVTATGNITVDAEQNNDDAKGLLDGGNSLVSGSGIRATAGVADVTTSSPGALLIKGSKALGSALFDVIRNKSPKVSQKTKGQSSEIKLSAATAYIADQNEVVARIGDDATADLDAKAVISETGDISLDATAASRPNVSASSNLDKPNPNSHYQGEASPSDDSENTSPEENNDTFGGSAGIAIGNYTNTAKAYINNFARVDAKQDLSITSETLNDYSTEWGVNLDEALRGDGSGTQKAGDFISTLTGYLDNNLALDKYVFDSWSQANANSGADMAVAGAVTVVEMNQTSKAFIGENARINQNTTLRSETQDVIVDAKSVNESVHFGGNIQLPAATWNYDVSLTTRGGGTGTEGKSAIGGSILVLDYINNVTAKVEEDVTLYADSLAVTANSKTMNVSIGAAGGEAERFGFSGVGSWVSVDNTTTANIAGGATLVIGDNSVDGTSHKSLVVEATDTTDSINILGGVTSSQSVGVGATIGFNTINRKTRAVIGNLTDADGTTKTSLTSAGDIKVRADNNGSIGSFSLAAAKTAPDNDEEQEESEQGPSYGVGISGDASVNEITDTTEAYLRHVNLNLTQASELDVTAQNSSNILAIGGAAALSMGDATQQTRTTVGVAGSYGQNTIKQETQAYLQTVTQQSDSATLSDVSVEAENKSQVFSVNAGLSGAIGATTSELNLAIAGAVTLNEIDNKTRSYIRGSSLTNLTNTSIDALDNTQIHSNAGGAALAFAAGTQNSNTSASAGVGLAINDVTNEVSAFVEKSTLTAGGNVSVNAESKSTVEAFALGAAASVSSSASANGISLSGAGAGAKNEINNTIQAYLSNGSNVTTTGSGTLAVTATDESKIVADSGGFSLALAAGQNATAASVGASVAENVIHNTIKAEVDSSTVTAAGDVTIAADSKATIDALSISGSLAAASGTQSSIALAGAGASTTNRIDNDIKARVKGSTITTKKSADVEVTAKDQSKIKADAGGIALAAASVGASIASNQIGKNQGHSIQATIEDSTVTTAGQVALSATSTATIDGLAFSGAGALGAAADGFGLALAGAGTGIDNDIKATILAAITDESDVDATGDVTIAAEDQSKITADAGAGAAALGLGSKGSAAASVGIAIADNSISNTVQAYVQGSTVSAQNLALNANSKSTINTFGLAGAIALSAGSKSLSLAGSGTAATNSLNNTIQAFISDGSTITTTGNLNQTATDQSTIKSLAVGGSIAVAGGGLSGAIAIGVVTVDNTISNTVQSFIGYLSDDSTTATVGGNLNLKAESALDLTENKAVAASVAASIGKGFAFSGAGANITTTTTNVVEAFIQNVDSTTDTHHNINVTGNLSVQATDTPTVWANIGSAAGVVGLFGGSVGVSTTETTIDNQVRAYIDNARVDATQDVDVKAKSTPTVDVISTATSIAASIGGAGAGAEALGTVKSTVEARIDGSNVTGDDITVVAESDDRVRAKADGTGIGAVATGASVAKAKANSNTQAYVSNATVTADNLDIAAETTGEVDADATAAGGGTLGVATASRSDAVNDSNVKASIGAGSSLTITETLEVKAKSSSDQDAKADGYNGSGVLAMGANVATATSDLTTEAVLETGVNITATDLTITAEGLDDNFADSIAGGGGLVSGQAATSVTDSKSRSSVRIEDGDSTANNVEINVTGALDITAHQTTTFNGKANSVNASVVGGSGASVTNTVNTDATVDIGVDTDGTQQDLAIEAGSLTVNATQTIKKAELSDQTAEAASGGAIDGSAVVSKTTIENRTEITIGDSLTSNGFGTDISTTGDMLLNAFNDVSAWDEVKLDSGGLISAAIAESKLLHRVNDAIITIQDAALKSGQAMTLSALANVDLDTTANASSYGLAGLPMGITKATSDTRNQIQLMNGASLRTEGDVNLLAGQAADGSTNQLDVNARSNIWNNTAAPLVAPGSSEASIKLENSINVADGALVESVRDANLIAVEGTVSSEAVRKSQDLYSKTAGAITGASTANIKTKRDDITSDSGVTVDGVVKVSIDNKETLTIAEAINLNHPITVNGETVYSINTTEKTDGIGDLTLTVEDLKNNIETELTRLRGLKANHAGNAAAVASYTAEINFLTRQLEELGDVSQAVYINVPDITVKTGDIRVIGDYLQGSGDLNSPGDAEIKITNHSPYYLRVNNLTVPEVQGGRILFNSALVTDNESINQRNDSQYQANFGEVITAENSAEAIIEVENTYDPTFAEQASAFAARNLSKPGAPDIEVAGAVDNFKGTVRLANNEGSVLVNGSLNAKTVEIDSGSDFILSDEDEEGFFHVGGDPRSQLADVADVSERTPNLYTRTGTPPGITSNSSITASNNVFISARYLNVNGLIQSGTPDRNVNLGSNLNADISAFKAAYDSNPTGSSKYRTLTTDQGGTSIEARYNAETNQIELDNVEIQGGYMQLVGNIISTGNGKLEVLDGFGRIGVTNRTNYELVVNRLDTGGDGIEGQLQIVDTAKRGSNGEALITTYTRLGDNITKTDTSGNTTTLSNTRTANYDPRAHQRYTWVTGQAFITETVKLYKDKSQFGIDGLIDDSKLEKETITLLDETPLLEGAFVETRNSSAAYDYSRETVTLAEEERVNREKWKETKGFLNTKKVYYQEDTYQTGEKTFNTHSYQADSRINIEFIGYETGSVSIDSTQNVFLVDSIENQGGTTTLNSHNSKLTHLSTIGAVVSDRLLLNNHTITDLRTDVNQLQFTTKGKATITDIQGDVTISGASAALFSPVELSVEGSLLGSGSGAYDLRGSQVSVTSRNGSIGSDDQALRINSAITSHSTWSPAGFNGWAGLKLEAAQDINVNETEGDLYLVSAKAGGDVTLGALAGSVFDNNNAETVDPYSQQQLDELWESMQLTTDRSGQAIASFKQQATQLYETYWNYRNATATADGGYTADAYDPNFAYQYSEAAKTDLLDQGYSEASITQLEAEKTQEYHTLHTLFSGGSVDLPEGQAHLATVIEDIFRDSDFSGRNLTDLSSYDPGLVEQQYQVSTQQQDALSQGSQWTQAELKNTMRSGTFGSTADTQYTVEDANITAGGDVTVTASGSIGHTAGTLTIDNWSSKDWSDLSSQEQLALSYAERDDLTYFDAAGNVIENPEQSSAAIASIQISLKQDVDIDAAGEINLTASQHIFLGSERDINLDQVQAGSTVRIKAAEGVYDVAAENTVNITSGDLVLEAGNASIGSRQAAITVDLDDSQEAGLTARAEDEIHIENVQGKLKIEGAYSGEGATFSSADDIEVETNRLAGGPVNLRGDDSDNHIELIANSAEMPVNLVVDGGAGEDQVVVTPIGEEVASGSPDNVEAIVHWSLSEVTGTAAVNEGSLGAAVSATYVGHPNLDVEGLVANSDGAVYFDGINDGITLTSHADINLSSQAQRSIELWFKADDLNDKQVIYEEGGALNGVNLYLDGDRLNFGIWANRKGQWLEHSVQANQIYHAVLVFDQGQLTAYVNGEAIGQVATGFSALPAHGDPAGIAQVRHGTFFAGNVVDSSSQHSFQGVIDDFSLYNDALSADAIAQRYSVGQQPMAHWSLSETTGNQAVNEGTLGSEVGATYVGTPDLDAEGLVAEGDGAVYFDGINDGVNITSHADINLGNHAQRTIELWFKAEDLDGRQVIYEEGGGANGVNLHLDGDRLNFGTWTGSKRGWLNHSVEANTTYHAVLVFDQGQLSAYINGESIGQVATGFSVLPVRGNGVGIAKTHGNTRFADDTHSFYEANHFHGTVDDLSLYNDALSADAIAQRYATNLKATAHWSLSETTGGRAVNEGTLGSDVWGLYAGSPDLDAEGLVADGDGAVYFDGVNDGVNITNHADINLGSHAQRSIELWFKAGDLDGKQVIYEEGGTGNGINLYLDGDRLNFGIWAGGNRKWLDHTVEANTTYHAVLVFDQGQFTAYVNGESIGQVATGFAVLPPHGGGVGIGKVNHDTRFVDSATGADHANYFHGTIDDVSLYNDAISAEAIARRYASQAPEENTSGITGKTLQNIQYRNLERLDGGLLNTGSATTLAEDGNATLTVLNPGDTAQITHINGQEVSADATVTIASGAEVSVNADGTLAYDTAGRFSSLSVGDISQDSFTYSTLDENGVSNTATLRVNVTGVNDGPVANDDQATTLENGTVTFSALSNDTDIDLNDVLRITQVNGQDIAAGATKVLASGAKVTFNSDGTFSYDPNGQFEDLPSGQTAQDSFSYTLSDGKGGTETATVTLTIQGQDDALVAVTDVINVSEDGQQTINVLGNDQGIELDETVTFTDVNGQQLSVGSTLTLESGAKLTLNADGSFTYNPDGKFEYLSVGQTVQESFTYSITDGQGDTSTATVTLTVNGANDGPVARADYASVTEEGVKHIRVFNNDSDIDQADNLRVTHINGIAFRNRTVTLDSGATVKSNGMWGLVYNPNGQFSGLSKGEVAIERFTYTLSDGQGGTTTSTVTVRIDGIGGGLVARGGSNNPFNQIDLGTTRSILGSSNNTAPAFIDLDGDNDLDMVVTESDGTIHYYRRDGGRRFTHVTGNANPFNGVKALGGVAPSFADIDGDGDLDAFVPGTKDLSAGQGSTMMYLRNDNGTFNQVSGNANPLNGVLATASPEFVDIDNDGDLDAFVRDRSQIHFYRNNGGQFTKDVGNNPFASYQNIFIPNQSENIRFADLDQDGDLDGFLLSTSVVNGTERSEVLYFENNGGNFSNAKSQADADNPFNLVGDTVGNHLRGLTFVDLDRDGDLDAAFGGDNGRLHYFQNM